jgi:hypothetical protein
MGSGSVGRVSRGSECDKGGKESPVGKEVSAYWGLGTWCMRPALGKWVRMGLIWIAGIRSG